jgi:hypothetical protein
MGTNLLPREIRALYEVHEWKHACAILKNDYPGEWKDIIDVLNGFRLLRAHMLERGGGLGPVSKYFNKNFSDRGWKKQRFETIIEVNKNRMESPTHEVDCVKNGIALEIEWSNKDPFFDRDLNNFRLLFDLRAISVGVIITKSDELMMLMKEMGKEVWEKYGTSTTWMGKLRPRADGGGGGGCPILVFGIKRALLKEV